MFSKDVPLSLHSPSLNPTVMTPLFHRSVFHSLCSPIMFPISYFPQRYPAVPMLLSPFPGVPQKIIGTGTKLGNIRTDYRDWGTSGIFWEHRDWKHCSVGGHWCWGTKGLREYRDWGAEGLGNILDNFTRGSYSLCEDLGVWDKSRKLFLFVLDMIQTNRIEWTTNI